MKIRKLKNICRKGAITVLFIVMTAMLIVNSGCSLIDVLWMPTQHEKQIPPEYNLQAQQDRKVLVWIECPRSSNVDYDVEQTLANTLLIYMTGRAGFDPANIIPGVIESDGGFAGDPIDIAREKGAGYLLLLQVDDYELMPLNIRNYYTGQMLSHTALYDVDLGVRVWPKTATAKITRVDVDLETKGRAEAMSRLVSATAHCTMRTLYPCKQDEFKTRDEKITVQDAYDMETF